MPPVLVRTPLVDQAITRLGEQIAAGRWEVGARLPAEPLLAQDLGVGRSTIREAVRVLAHSGLLEVRQGAGTFVRARSVPGELAVRLQRAGSLEVYEVRRALEVEAAILAAVRRTAADLAAIDGALDRRRAARLAREGAGFLAADLDFHQAVVIAAHNPLLSELYAGAMARIARAIADVMADTALTEDTSGLHDDLAEAVRAQDPRAAAAAVRLHLEGTHRALADLVGR
jgi:DNA-binding FadR family transcriptional regulator